MTAAMVGQPGFPKKLLEPEDVADAIVAQILSGQSGQIFLPKGTSLVSGIRGFPLGCRRGSGDGLRRLLIIEWCR